MNLNNAHQQVLDFMTESNQYLGLSPHIPLQDILDFRYNLIQEENLELSVAFQKCFHAITEEEKQEAIAELADAIGDSIYVLIGLFITCGLDTEKIFNEIHRSNMTKFIDGHKREDGKWIKGPSFEPPKLRDLIFNKSSIKE